MRWELVPLMPKEETAARRGRPLGCHSTSSVSSSTLPFDQSTLEEGVSTWSVLGSRPSRMAIVILITPATPAAEAAWPMFDLIEPR